MRYRFFLALLCGFSPVFAQNAAPVQAEDLFRLIRAGDTDGLRRAAGNPNVVSSLGEAPLHYAATFGSVDSVRVLLERGADPNARNRSGATPLISGAYNFEKARLLVEKGADVNAHSQNGVTPLMVAA